MGVTWGLAGLLVTPAGILAEKIGLYQTLLFISFIPFLGLLMTITVYKKLSI